VPSRFSIPAKLFRAIALVWTTSRGWTLVNIVLLIAQGILPLVSIYLLKLIIDAVTAALASPDKTVAFGHVALLIALAGGAALLASALQSLSGIVEEAQGQTITDHVHDLLHAKSIEVDLEYYENSKYYDAFHRAQAEAPYRPASILRGLIKLGQNGISLTALAGLLFSLHWGVTLILFAAAAPSVFLRLRFSRKLYRWHLQRTAAERQANHFSWMLTSDLFAKEIRLFGLGPLFIESFRSLRRKLRAEKISLAARRGGADFAGQAAATLAIFGSFAFMAGLAVRGVITLGDLVMYFQAFQRGLQFLRDFLTGLAGLYEDSLFLTSFYEFLDLPKKVDEPSWPRIVPRPFQDGIVFENVSFRYLGGQEDALKDVNLRLRPGEAIALVGESGSGKTTLIKLLCRLYDPGAGRILLDGMDLREYSVSGLRREISVIFQDFAHYHLTARENIWFGNIDLDPAKDGPAGISEASRRAGADDVIRKLRRGYDTVLGKWFEDGEEISIGEWQKIALARSFLRDSQIIVLDEPTSSLDARAESEVFARFRELAKSRSTIIISHRFSTVRMADTIYVFENGRIVESGHHDALVSKGGNYSQLYEMQARNYK